MITLQLRMRIHVNFTSGEYFRIVIQAKKNNIANTVENLIKQSYTLPGPSLFPTESGLTKEFPTWECSLMMIYWFVYHQYREINRRAKCIFTE